MKIAKIVLTLVILALFYFLYETIAEPIRFNDAKEKRYDATVERLKDIRTLQMAFKDEHRAFADNFDVLTKFYSKDSVKTVKMIGDPNDTTQTVTYDTLYAPVKGNVITLNYPADSLPYIPYTNEKFDISAGFIEKNRVKIPVFEVRAPNNILLKGLDKQFYDPYDGLQVGSMTEPTYTGNWE